MVWKPFDADSADRRTIYAMMKRSLMIPMLEVLDVCDATRSAGKRNVTSVAPQAPDLYNGDFINRQSRELASRLIAAETDHFRSVDAGLSPRPWHDSPTADELEQWTAFIGSRSAARFEKTYPEPTTG